MTHIFPLYFLIPELPNLNSQKYIERYGNQVRQSIADSQRGLLQHFLSLGNTNGLALSIRYFYDPNNSKDERLKIYMIFNYLHNDSQQLNLIREEIISFVQISNLSVFYNFDLSPGLNQCQNLEWVNHIGEALKPESFNSQGYYVPHLFEANKNNNMLNVCDILNRLNEKFLLEITLQVCQKSEDRSEWAKALAQVIPQLQLVTSHRRDSFFEGALSIYQHYQTTYLHSNLFKYSIKALAQTRSNIRPVLMELVRSATEAKSHGEQDCVEILSRDVDTQKFLKSLKSTENVEICTAVERKGWQDDFGDKLIRQSVKPKISNNELGDGSTDIHKPFTSYLADFNNAALAPSSIGEIVRSSPSAITQSFNSSGKSPFALIKDLKPLHRYATLEEISGFFRIVIPGKTPVPGIPQERPKLFKLTAEEIVRKYGQEMTENPDKYIVGMADDGSVVYSSWNNDPHRLVAGRPGYGKSNFLHWIIFQFLYANPKRKVYIADFGGADFQYLEDMNLNIEIVINSKGCKELVEKIHQQYEERLSLMRQFKVNNIKKIQARGVEIDRMLWIIDEAAAIARADKELKKVIEQRLEEYVLQGRKFGIHVIYCTQFPTSEVVSRQVRENCGEKVVFRLSPDATDTVLGYRLADEIASAPKGRAFVEGQDGGQYVNTPEIILPEETIVPISGTIWRYLDFGS